jgi:hypothetical protein
VVIADAIDDRFRLLVLLGAWSRMRWGELLALTGRVTPSPEPCLVRLTELVVRRRQAAEAVDLEVRRLVGSGVGWGDLGRSLGMTVVANDLGSSGITRLYFSA